MLPWTPRMQFQHPRRKTRKEAGNFQLSVWKWWENSIVFQNSFFQIDFIDTKKAVLTGRPNFSCSITGNDLKKSPQKMQKLFRKFSSKSYQGEVESSLKATLTCFGRPTENFPLNIQKMKVCKFCKEVSPTKVSFKTGNPVLRTRWLFLQELVKKIRCVQRWKKKLELKLFFVKMLFWTRKMQF